jgi:membrane protein
VVRIVALVTGLLALYQRFHLFVGRDIWRADLTATSRLGAIGIYPLRVVLIVVRGFWFEHQGLLRASALTYSTLLSLVPILAFALAFLKGLGVNNLLEPFLITMGVIGSEETVRMLLSYASNIEISTLGGIGLGTLVFTTVLGVGNVERAFNEIWGVHTERPILRKIADYASVLVLGPVALLLATGINTRLHSPTFVTTWLGIGVIGEAVTLFSTVMATMLPYVALWLVFAFFYSFLPNTRVQAIPAVIGGVVGGTLWQIAQWGYIAFQVGMANAQAIYGALAQLPVLMLWIYVSWVTTLLGAEVAYACQHVTTYFPARLVHCASMYVREWLAHTLYFSLVRAFIEGTGTWSAVTFAQQHHLPLRLLHEILTPLQEAGLLVETATSPDHYVPGRDPASITPWHLLQALQHYGDQTLGGILTLHDPLTARLMAQIEEAQQQAAGTYTIPQWLAGKDTAGDGERSPS